MEHIPAIHAAKVGMRYPARVVGWEWGVLELDLDLSTLAPGRVPALRANLQLTRTVAAVFANMLAPGHRVEVALIEVDRQQDRLFASLSAPPDWLTWNNGTVRQLAQRIRETAEYDLLPILADALEEAGCTDHTLLARCRRPEDDNLCWLVELLATQE